MDLAAARNIPQVDRLLRDPAIESECRTFRRELMTELIRREIEVVRQQTLDGKSPPETDEIISRVIKASRRMRSLSLSRVINGTGVILNTNLGRAPLPPG